MDFKRAGVYVQTLRPTHFNIFHKLSNNTFTCTKLYIPCLKQCDKYLKRIVMRDWNVRACIGEEYQERSWVSVVRIVIYIYRDHAIIGAVCSVGTLLRNRI